MCVRACVHMCVRACERGCVRVCVRACVLPLPSAAACLLYLHFNYYVIIICEASKRGVRGCGRPHAVQIGVCVSGPRSARRAARARDARETDEGQRELPLICSPCVRAVEMGARPRAACAGMEAGKYWGAGEGASTPEFTTPPPIQKGWLWQVRKRRCCRQWPSAGPPEPSRGQVLGD